MKLTQNQIRTLCQAYEDVIARLTSAHAELGDAGEGCILFDQSIRIDIDNKFMELYEMKG